LIAAGQPPHGEATAAGVPEPTAAAPAADATLGENTAEMPVFAGDTSGRDARAESDDVPDRAAGWPYIERRRGPRPGALRRALPALAAAAIVLAIAASGAWYVRDDARRDANAATASRLAAARHQDSAAATVAQAAAIPVENAADSASASAYAIEIVVANTQEGAATSLTDEQRLALPATTVGPVVYPGDTARWFRVLIGATPEPAAADSLLASLRGSHRFASDAGKVVRVPVALLVARDQRPDSARVHVRALRLIGIPAYALLQPDGTARVYVGAFEAPDQTTSLADQLRAAGLAPAVVYRTGRPF
jgi:hypothetical protein